MKKLFQDAEFEIIRLANADILTTSTGNVGDGSGESEFGEGNEV